tara:strand:+ start:564 stop:842 length:279 start_codon:yes stop_codon:yes gene_type:complete
MTKVKNMKSSSGNKVANQFEIWTEDARIFQSYNSIIAKIMDNGQIYLDELYWDYSVTTGKYRNQFLDEGIAETRKKIEEGAYILTDLNKEVA